MQTQTSSADIQQQLASIQNSKRVISQCTADRQEKYVNSIKSYLNYIHKESRLLQSNIKHCAVRNEQYMNQIGKTWERINTSSRRNIQIMNKTNKDKKQLQKYLDSLEVADPIQPVNSSQLMRERTEDLSKYKEILQEYRSKLR